MVIDLQDVGARYLHVNMDQGTRHGSLPGEEQDRRDPDRPNR